MNKRRATPHTSECSSWFHTSATNPNKRARIHQSPAAHSTPPQTPAVDAPIRSPLASKPARFDSNSPPFPQKSGVANCIRHTPHPISSRNQTTALARKVSPIPPPSHEFLFLILDSAPKRGDDASQSANRSAMSGFPASGAALHA